MRQDSIARTGGLTPVRPPSAAPPAGAKSAPVSMPAVSMPAASPPVSVANDPIRASRSAEAKLRLELATRSRNRYDIEIHKKFSLAAACLIFVLVGAPIAVRFPRGGVGLVIGVSLVVFALYYVGLIGGEALANEGHVPPFWAMWGTNVILTVVGLVLLFKMGSDSTSNRGGDWSDRLDAIKARFGRGPLANLRRAS
jgi:lipopolysaccharide export system permease protein